MSDELLSELQASHEQVVALARTIPDEAFDWQPDADSWSLKRTLAHITSAYDFYVMIVEQARAADFGTVSLPLDSAVWQPMRATESMALACKDVASLLDLLASVYGWTLLEFQGITSDELDRSLVLMPWQDGGKPETTTLRARVLEMATRHLREHHQQLEETLAAWRKQSQQT